MAAARARLMMVAVMVAGSSGEVGDAAFLDVCTAWLFR